MKRFLFVAILVSIFAIGNVSAQVISYSQTTITKEQKEKKPVELRQFAGAEWGSYPKDPYAKMSLGAYYEIGAMLNKSIFLGGGLGLGNSFSDLNLLPETLTQSEMYDLVDLPKGVVMKAYIDSKFYLTKTKLKPYFDLSIGGIINNFAGDPYRFDYNDKLYYFDVNEMKNWIEFDVFANPQFGLDYHIGRNVKSIFVNAGYFLPILNMVESGMMEGFRVKLGITF